MEDTLKPEKIQLITFAWSCGEAISVEKVIDTDKIVPEIIAVIIRATIKII